MVLTNAERQKRFRARLKAAASAATGLTPEQSSDRDAVMAEPLYPVPSRHMREQMPRFMGWDRYEWSAAPMALADHFGMRTAWKGWKAERDALEAQSREQSAKISAKAERIISECGEPARALTQRGGTLALLRAYEADPTLGAKPKQKRPVT